MKTVALVAIIFSSQILSAENQNKIKPTPHYQILGLKTGDVLISYDESHVINSPKEAMDLYNKVGSGKIRSVVVVRNGKKETLKVLP